MYANEIFVGGETSETNGRAASGRGHSSPGDGGGYGVVEMLFVDFVEELVEVEVASLCSGDCSPLFGGVDEVEVFVDVVVDQGVGGAFALAGDPVGEGGEDFGFCREEHAVDAELIEGMAVVVFEGHYGGGVVGDGEGEFDTCAAFELFV